MAAMAPIEQATLRPIVYYEFLQGHSARAAADNICAAFKGNVVHYSTAVDSSEYFTEMGVKRRKQHLGRDRNDGDNRRDPNVAPDPPQLAPGKLLKGRLKKGKSKSSPAFLANLLKVGGASAVVVVGLYLAIQGYMETRVNTPFKSEKVTVREGLEVPERFWGTYRPGTYFGMKTRTPGSLVVGLMWLSEDNIKTYELPPLRPPYGISSFARHWCQVGEDVRANWEYHDGSTFGTQILYDKTFNIRVTFVKEIGGRHGGDWTFQLEVEPKVYFHVPCQPYQLFFAFLVNISEDDSPSIISLQKPLFEFMFNFIYDAEQNISYIPPIFHQVEHLTSLTHIFIYITFEEESTGWIEPVFDSGKSSLKGVVGSTPYLGNFDIEFEHISGAVIDTYFLRTASLGIERVHDVVKQSLVRVGQRSVYALIGEQLVPNHESDLIVYEVISLVQAGKNLQFNVMFKSGSFTKRSAFLKDAYFVAQLEKHRTAFEDSFQHVFNLREHGIHNESLLSFGKAALSNMLGSIGYFYGSSRVISHYNKQPVPYWKAPLYTGVPSRSFFPRGFLWDEGFHNLLIAQYNKEMTKDIMSHWFDLMNVEGWIPREQILGKEARQRTPEPFIVQHNTNANPPAFLLTVEYLLKEWKDSLTTQDAAFLQRLWPRLVAWYNWFNTTQGGNVPGSYRWRGRFPYSEHELNPKTLTSGFDDYPRASHPDEHERHLDLHCWMAFSSKVLSDLADLIGEDSSRFQGTYHYLRDSKLLDSLYWSDEYGAFTDYGMHSENVQLQKPPLPYKNPNPDRVRVTLEPAKLTHVNFFGYLNLFPFFLHLIEPNSPRLKKILDDLPNPSLLWTKHGLRSLAKSSNFYQRKNTDHDPPYWRGDIWMNMNFLALRALHHYANVPGPYKSQAQELYSKLRMNVIETIYNEYLRTGYFWERYSDKTGQGKGCSPFNGWTSLVLL
ncbi:unnamed protein product, partial [Darwinula stevensoni]